MLQQSAREDVRLEARAVSGRRRTEAALGVRPTAAPAPARGVEDLDHAVYPARPGRRTGDRRGGHRPATSSFSGAPAEADREERPDGLRRRARSVMTRSASRSGRARGRCPTCSRAPIPVASLEVEACDEQRARLRVADGVEDRVVREERVAGEVHLRHEPLGEQPAEDREVDVRRPPRVLVVAPRICAGLHRR